MVTTTLGEHGLSWVVLAVLAVIVVVVILLIVVLTRVGGGRSHGALASTGQQNPLGRVTVRDEFVADAVKDALDRRDEILFSAVSASTVRKHPVMHLSVTPRQNTSPRAVAQDLDLLLENLSALTGRDVPTYVSLRSGLRARLARDQRRLD